MSSSGDSINITREDLKELKLLYDKTPANKTFIFKGREVLKEFAGYMIEYLEQQFGETK
jgi:hypothetical protein